jgi:hypothetical protein
MPTCHQTVAYLDALHSQEPTLPFDGEFAMPFAEWQLKWNRANLDLAWKLCRQLREEGTPVAALRQITNRIIEHTLLNIKAGPVRNLVSASRSGYFLTALFLT